MGYYESKRRGALVNPTIEIGNVNASTNALMGNLNNFVSNQRQQDAANVQQAQREEALALEAEKYKAAQARLATQDAMAATAFNTQQLIRNNQLAEYGRKVDQRNTLADLNKNFTTVGMKQGMGLTEADINAQYSKANDAYEKGLVTKGLDRTNEQIAAMSPKQRDAWRESTKGLYTDPFDNGKGTGQADFEKKYLKSFNTATDATYTQRHDAIIKAYTDKGIPREIAEQQAALRLKGVQTEAQKAESFNTLAKEQYDREKGIYDSDIKLRKVIMDYNKGLTSGGSSTGGGKNTISSILDAKGVEPSGISESVDKIDAVLKAINSNKVMEGKEKLTTVDVSRVLAGATGDLSTFGWIEDQGVNEEALKSLMIQSISDGNLKHTKKGTPIALPSIKEPKYQTYKPKKAKTAKELLDIYKEPEGNKVVNLETTGSSSGSDLRSNKDKVENGKTTASFNKPLDVDWQAEFATDNDIVKSFTGKDLELPQLPTVGIGTSAPTTTSEANLDHLYSLLSNKDISAEAVDNIRNSIFSIEGDTTTTRNKIDTITGNVPINIIDSVLKDASGAKDAVKRFISAGVPKQQAEQLSLKYYYPPHASKL